MVSWALHWVLRMQWKAQTSPLILLLEIVLWYLPQRTTTWFYDSKQEKKSDMEESDTAVKVEFAKRWALGTNNLTSDY